MHRRCASWLEEPLHTPTGVLHKTTFSDEALFRFSPQDKAFASLAFCQGNKNNILAIYFIIFYYLTTI